MSNDHDLSTSELFNRLSKSEISLSIARGTPSQNSGITFDVAKYLGYVEGMELSEKEAKELLTAIWQVVTCFVELGFGTHPVQQAMDNSTLLERDSTPNVVASAESNSTTHSTANGATTARRRGEIHEPV